jgi:hypothetical protein
MNLLAKAARIQGLYMVEDKGKIKEIRSLKIN